MYKNVCEIAEKYQLKCKWDEHWHLVGISDQYLIYEAADSYEKEPIFYDFDFGRFVSDLRKNPLQFISNKDDKQYISLETFGDDKYMENFLLYNTNDLCIDDIELRPVYTITGTHGDNDNMVEVVYRLPASNDLTYEQYVRHRTEYSKLLDKLDGFECRYCSEDTVIDNERDLDAK